VTVENLREEKKGGKELSLIGNERGSYGIPTGVNAGAKKTANSDVVMANWAADCLQAAGYKATTTADPANPQVHIKLETLWSEMIPVPLAPRYETWIKATIQVLPAGGGAATWEKQLTADGGTTTIIVRFNDPIETGFIRSFDQLSGAFLAEIATDAFQAALPGGNREAATAAIATLGKEYKEKKN
jgi:adenine deaminase